MDSPKTRHFFSTRHETLSVLKQVRAPHLVLISEQLNDGSGLDQLREIKRLNPDHRCIVVLNQNSVSAQRLARQLHADACIDETSLQERKGALIHALEAVQGGKIYIDPRLQDLIHLYNQRMASRSRNDSTKFCAEWRKGSAIATLVSDSTSRRIPFAITSAK